MADLKLAKLPDRTPVKVTSSFAPDLYAALVSYLSLYRATYDDTSANVADLIPAMLAAFLESDRGFQKHRASNRDA